MRSRVLVAFASLCAAPAAVAVQGRPGTNLTVTVRVNRIERHGDTALVEYSVRNAPGSQEELWTFTVEAPAAPVSIGLPSPPKLWKTRSRYGDLSVAHWAAIGPNIRPGSETPPLSFRAIGLPGIVPYYAEGFWLPPNSGPWVDLDTIPRVSERENLASTAVRGLTVGIEPPPPDRSPGALNERLRTFLSRTCALGWISNAGLCHRLQEKLDHAAQALERRNGSEEARRQLGAFLEELEDQHGPEPGRHADEGREPEARHDPEPGKPVNAGAYWLLKINVEYLLGLIPGHEAGER